MEIPVCLDVIYRESFCIYVTIVWPILCMPESYIDRQERIFPYLTQSVNNCMTCRCINWGLLWLHTWLFNHLTFEWYCHDQFDLVCEVSYWLRSRGDNAFGTVRLFVCLSKVKGYVQEVIFLICSQMSDPFWESHNQKPPSHRSVITCLESLSIRRETIRQFVVKNNNWPITEPEKCNLSFLTSIESIMISFNPSKMYCCIPEERVSKKRSWACLAITCHGFCLY